MSEPPTGTVRAARMRWMENVAYGLVGFSASRSRAAS